MRYSVIAAKDGDVYHDEVEAADQEEAERKAREQVAEAWNMGEELKRAIADDDVLGWFDAELDGFAVDPISSDLISRSALLAGLRAMRDSATEGEDRNPDDAEWTTIRECYEDTIRAVEAAK